MGDLRHLVDRTIAALVVPRSLAWLLLASLALGLIFAASMLPLRLVLGVGDFWTFPQGTIAGSDNDMAQILVGYLYLQHGPWMFPLLFAPNLNAPAGTNIFWLDAIPWISLSGKLILTSTGLSVNLLGAYLLACLCLPGVAMTLLLAAAGQRSMLAMIAGTFLAEATPYLLFRWGHMATFAQFFIVLALALYVQSRRTPDASWVPCVWLLLLSIAFLNNLYLFTMVGGCWAAALAQRRLDRAISNLRTLSESAAAIGLVATIAVVTGIATPDLRSAGSSDFGLLSMNLLSPFIPQMSGVISLLADYRVGMSGQYEGFNYLGLGVLLTLAVLLFRLQPVLATVRRHPVLLCFLAICCLFAVSNRVFLGTHLLLAVPLPASLINTLGAFRSSGRFFWPVGYVCVAIGILVVVRTYRPAVAAALLGAASILQLLDVAPLRAAIAETAGHAAPAIANRAAIARLVSHADAIRIFPSYGCVYQGTARQAPDHPTYEDLLQANMEFELASARADLPINSVYNSRIATDCAAENRGMGSPLQAGVAYVYLLSYHPTLGQLAGNAAGEVCATIDWIAYCLLPRPSTARAESDRMSASLDGLAAPGSR